MSLVIAFSGTQGAAIAGDMREIFFSGDDAAIQHLECELYNGVVRSLSAFRGQLPAIPFIRTLRCAQFRRLRPLREGRQRGTPIVRHYWDVFLMKNSRHIHGRCLEVGSTATLRSFGRNTPLQADAIDLVKHSPEITVVADLTKADHVPSDVYDCFVSQFTTTFVYDAESALYHSVRILKPGGVLLINFPCVEYYFATGLDMDTGPPIFMYWWFTPIMVENLLRRIGVTEKDYTLEIFGNLFSRIAYQMNMPAEDSRLRSWSIKTAVTLS